MERLRHGDGRTQDRGRAHSGAPARSREHGEGREDARDGDRVVPGEHQGRQAQGQPEQEGRPALLLQPEEQQRSGARQERQQADLHAAQRPVDQGEGEGREEDREEPGPAPPRAGEEPRRRRHHPDLGEEDERPRDHHCERGLRERQRQEVDRRHPQRPQQIGISLHRRHLARVPDQPMPRRQVVGVAHGDHGVVEQGVVALPADREAGAHDEEGVEDERTEADQPPEEFRSLQAGRRCRLRRSLNHPSASHKAAFG